jgi:hypothetical protein
MTGDDVKQKFDQEWGAVRRFVSANPGTGVIVSFLAGALIAGIVRIIAHGLGLA